MIKSDIINDSNFIFPEVTMEKKVIYVIDDEIHILELIRYNLANEGYIVKTFEDSDALYEGLRERIPDLIFLDIMLNGENGFDICKKIRANEKTRTVPVIFLTARSDEFDKVLGLELGADDYITKPFSLRELAARVKALMRRAEHNISEDPGKEGKIIKIKDIELDTERREVKKQGGVLQMTYKEFELLKLLMENKGKVIPREVLLNNVWGYDFFGESRTIDVHIRSLRKILGDQNEQYIETSRGTGYRFKD